MERTANIFRRSIHTFFQNYQYFTSTAAFLLLPVSVSVLLSQAVEFNSFPLLPTFLTRLQSLFDAAGFPPSSQFFFLLNLKLSQTISSSIFTFPFSLSFLLVAKAAIIQALHHKTSSSPPFSSSFSLYHPLLLTYLCNSFFIISAHATGLCILILLFNSFDAFGFSSPSFLFFLSAAGAVLYSVILCNTIIICNLALVVAGMENCGGFLAILKACFLIRGRDSAALSLALPVNLGLAFLEALLQYRLVRAYHLSRKLSSSAAFEGLLIAYLYSLFILGETIISCTFYKSCKSGLRIDGEDRYSHYRIENMEEA
ncbi:hypothetical protein BVC80_8771g30 [Macleaya cordata]|uniref:Transmembrane protein n=1 Tax=Macleaya cordata TaxID=56857 RepID=A0A200QSJ1_MACCD|nr:hypothetical protein BVC80_8771g30 [Macleaya cordata]